MKHVNIFADMDGFIAKYDRAGYIQPNDGGEPEFLKLGSHYFLDRESDERAITLLKALSCHDEFNIIILTKLGTSGDLFDEQVLDKKRWLKRYCPFIDVDSQFIAVPIDKADAVDQMLIATLGRHLNGLDVLIDDYNQNIKSWLDKGGSAFKYLNGINSFNDMLPCINLTENMSIEAMVRCFETYYLNLACVDGEVAE